MPLIDHVRITRRFQRSIKIDADFGSVDALQGFICSPSSTDVLLSVCQHVVQTEQAAFTWTGPYGGGKSSLILLLAALLSKQKKLRKESEKIVTAKVAREIWKALPPGKNGWEVLPIVGRRSSPITVIRDELIARGLISPKDHPAETWNDVSMIDILVSLANQNDGLLLVLDEMGKFLESAATNEADIYFFQLLAEAASRSKGRLLVVGILHQAFDEYAQRLAHQSRDEWAKVQGRFTDILVNVTGDEYLELLSNAIEVVKISPPAWIGDIASKVGKCRNSSPAVIETLAKCWPLHPAVSCLLGPISRRRFGQNQRSLFSFLGSAEPYGFQAFLRNHKSDSLYTTTELWNYLRVNLEPSILASPDGHRWATAVENIERADTLGVPQLQLGLLKAVALIELFKDNTGLLPSEALLVSLFPTHDQKEILSALDELKTLSFLIFKKHIDAYAIYAGSDFDIENALSEALTVFSDADIEGLKKQAALQPIVAKKHFHETGSFRWLALELVRMSDLESAIKRFSVTNGVVGKLFIVVPHDSEPYENVLTVCTALSEKSDDNVLIGVSKHAWRSLSLASELSALEDIKDNRRELAGDSIARREVSARIAELHTRLGVSLDKMFSKAEWIRKGEKIGRLSNASLISLASLIAEQQFPSAPHITNELLNRSKPSSNAVAALKSLLKRMVANEGEERLGIDGFPAEGGLCDSILLHSKLYQRSAEQGWHFAKPSGDDDRCNLVPAWDAALSHLKEAQDHLLPMNELYSLWSGKPFGLKEGLLPLLGVAFILANRSILAIYRNGVFQSRFTDLDIDYLTADPFSIELRWMDLPDSSREILYGLASLLPQEFSVESPKPIDVGRGLVAIYENLHPWVKRTAQLSRNAFLVRDLFKRSSDPNKFIFDDIPKLFSTSEEHQQDVEFSLSQIRDGIDELNNAYASMLTGLSRIMLSELQVHNESSQSYKELHARAKNIIDVGGDFRLNSFTTRLSRYKGSIEDIEGIASLVTSVVLQKWVDSNVEQAKVGIAEMAQKFLRAESYARVKGRKDKRQALAVFVGINGRPTPVDGEFEITDKERPQIDALVKKLQKALSENKKSIPTNQVLAALAELSAFYLKENAESKYDAE